MLTYVRKGFIKDQFNTTDSSYKRQINNGHLEFFFWYSSNKWHPLLEHIEQKTSTFYR